MKKTRLLIVSAVLTLAVPFAVYSFAAEKSEHHEKAGDNEKEKGADKEKDEKPVIGSIRPSGEIKPVDLPALAKISFEAALKAALAAQPGSVIKAELEVEGGNLMYAFEIVSPAKKVIEVEIDAGNGKVLDIDED